MKVHLHCAESRGRANHGWLDSHHSFSFANYHNPKRMGFGTLRVINDDVVAPAMGFGTHSHRNMEIISIPLSGSLKHEDTIGNKYVITNGEVQTMTAGTGIAHSEFNNSNEEPTNFLQIWVLPREQNIAPSYSQKKFDSSQRQGHFQLIISPDGREQSANINQNAYFSLIDFKEGQSVAYEKYHKENGVYFFLIQGGATICNESLKKRDGIGIEELDSIDIMGNQGAELLIMEVPMA